MPTPFQVRMSWCLMEERVKGVYNDVESIFKRLGGRPKENDPEPEKIMTMTEVQVMFLF